jgi:hypothetical protein
MLFCSSQIVYHHRRLWNQTRQLYVLQFSQEMLSADTTCVIFVKKSVAYSKSFSVVGLIRYFVEKCEALK